MQTSRNETIKIEDFIFDKMSVEEREDFSCEALINADLHEKILWQQRTYELINRFGRADLKKTLQSIHVSIMNDPANRTYRESISALFKK